MMRIAIRLAVGLAVLILAAGCATRSPEIGQWGVDLSSLSTTVAPGDDFYRYVNEGWIDNAEIPKGFPANNAFVEVSIRTQAQLTKILDGLPADAAPGTPAQQMSALSASYLDFGGREALGISPPQKRTGRDCRYQDT